MTNEEFIILAEKVAEGSASISEIALYNASYESFQQDPQSLTAQGLDAKELKKESLARFWKSADISTPMQKRLWHRLIGVAAAVAAIVFGVWFYNANYKNGRHPESNPKFSSGSGSPLANDIAPGKNTATIKIGDGEAITLSDKQTGVIVGDDLRYSDGSALQGVNAKAEVLKQVQDDVGGKRVTVTTPRGGTYQVTLPDGTKVWLNAASVLTYTMPLKERGGVRKVELSGEAYFEVFRNKLQPFVVTTKKLTTTVLGTHFNISAYDDEGSAKATLLEGSVRVVQMNLGIASSRSASRNDVSVASSLRGSMTKQPPTDGTHGVVLKPSQQASVTGNQSITVKQVDAEEAISWKEGYFGFSNETLESVMKKVSRWYDVQVVFADEKVKQKIILGSVSRYENLSKVIRVLERLEVAEFKIEGKTITIDKKK